MDKDKIDRVINAFRSAMYSEFSVSEEGMVANPPGGSGGFSGSANSRGPVAGYDSSLKFDGRNKFVRKAIKDLMDRRTKREERKAKKKALNYNPYFKPQDGRSS
tara:strand:- start:130 stop:441 length:312 start_codon:yes stop_codon:yes gene_type:complete